MEIKKTFKYFWVKKLVSLYTKSKFIAVAGIESLDLTTILINSVISQKFTTLNSLGKQPAIISIPSLLMRPRPKVEKFILSFKTEKPKEMDILMSFVKPTTLVLTRISPANLDKFTTMDDLVEDKAKFIRSLDKDNLLIINSDDKISKSLIDMTSASTMLYGTDPKECNVFADQIRIEGLQTIFQINYGVERVEIRLNALGKHLIYPSLAAASVGLSVGLSLINIKRGLEKADLSNITIQAQEGLDRWTVLEDLSSNTYFEYESALNILNEISARRRIAVLGEIKDLGSLSEKMHRKIAEHLFTDKIDLILLCGGDTRFIGDELIKLGYPAERLEVNIQNQQLVSKLMRILGKGDLVLVKGPKSVRLDEVVKRITLQK